jgi:hypothetical protein
MTGGEPVSDPCLNRAQQSSQNSPRLADLYILAVVVVFI